MKTSIRRSVPGVLAIAALLLVKPLYAADLADLLNYRAYSETLSSSGQPSEKQLRAVSQRGFERVIYLALSDHERALEHEDRVVTSLGMDYLHIPIVWAAPSRADFDAFLALMQIAPEQKTLVHCALNFRASSLIFLYRVLYLNVPQDEALEDLQGVWKPNATWQAFIFETLEQHGVSPHCEACLW
jgi:protein tyrosine phosphatase (PTP) superfamily phosphohydrolase (DUF442 family)